MEICEAFGLSVWPFDPMLKSSGVQGLPRGYQMHVLPPHQGWGAFIRRAGQDWTFVPRQPTGHPARVPGWPHLPPRTNSRLRQKLEGLGPGLGHGLLQWGFR